MGVFGVRACGPVGSLTRALAGGGVQIYTPRFCERNRACRHPRAVSHLLPTYINSSESSSKIDAQKKPQKNRHNKSATGVAALGGLTFPFLSLPDHSRCLYLQLRAGRTDGRTAR